MFQPNGISLHVEDHGSGKPVVLLHGCFAFVALRDGCVTNEDELRERHRLADLSEQWLVVHRAVHCRFSQMSGIVEATQGEQE